MGSRAGGAMRVYLGSRISFFRNTDSQFSLTAASGTGARSPDIPNCRGATWSFGLRSWLETLRGTGSSRALCGRLGGWWRAFGSAICRWVPGRHPASPASWLPPTRGRNRCASRILTIRLRPMLQTAEAPGRLIPPAGFPERYCQAYRWMLLARLAEERIANLYRGGKITGEFFSGRGRRR